MVRPLLLALALTCAAPLAQAENFTNTHFLKWEKRDRDQWLEGAVLMAHNVAHLKDKVKAKCVWDWYVPAPLEAQALIFASMQRYPDALPSATLIALMQHQCGDVFTE